MTAIDTALEERALRSLSERYALAADNRDVDSYVSVFLPDATLSMVVAGELEPYRVFSSAEIAGIPVDLGRRYDSTFHLLAQTMYDISSDEATGTIYCIAYSVVHGPDGDTNEAKYIRYTDTYRRDGDGQWKIADRRLTNCWTQLQTTLAPVS
jgi:ketosteroid isomerase-like protein